jgi:ABC-2 type transport system ATP-binding protein
LHVVEAENVVKRYGRVVALRGVSFTVPKGVIYGLLGPNGAGKTTTIKAITGAVRLTSGKVKVFGLNSWTHRYEVRSRLGVVTELPSLYPELSVLDNLAFVARMYGVTGEEFRGRLRSVSEALGLEEVLRARYGSLSKGFRRRVDIAAALIHDPDLLILDEPTAGLDVLAASRLRDAIRGLRKLGKSIIFSSHYIDEAMSLSDSVLLLYNGMKVAEDEPERLRERLGLAKRVRVLLGRELGPGEAEELLRRLWRSGVAESPRLLGRSMEFATRKPHEAIRVLDEALRLLRVEIVDVDVLPPSWEDVFKIIISKGTGPRAPAETGKSRPGRCGGP